MNFSAVFAIADAPTVNGRRYSRKILEETAIEWASRLQEGRPVLGYLWDETDRNRELNLAQTAAVLRSIGVDDKNRLVGSIRLLDTPMGKLAQSLWPMATPTISVGSFDSSGTAIAAKVIAFSLCDYKDAPHLPVPERGCGQLI